MSDWTKADEKPKANGRYLIHVLETPFISFAGLEKGHTRHSVSAGTFQEYVVEAGYCDGVWEFDGVYGDYDEKVRGSIKIVDGREYLYQIRVVEWKKLPGFVPVTRSFSPFADISLSEFDSNQETDPRTTALDNKDLSDFARMRYEACKTLSPCKYNKNGYAEYVEINNEEQFTALLDYYTNIETDNETGSISYISPKSDGYAGDGVYRIKIEKENMFLNMETGKTTKVPEQIIITKINNVSEMFR